jgi:hypothetical protein
VFSVLFHLRVCFRCEDGTPTPLQTQSFTPLLKVLFHSMKMKMKFPIRRENAISSATRKIDCDFGVKGSAIGAESPVDCGALKWRLIELAMNTDG